MVGRIVERAPDSGAPGWVIVAFDLPSSFRHPGTRSRRFISVINRSQPHSRTTAIPLTILAPGDFARCDRVSGRWVPFVYPFAIASWLRRRQKEFDLVMFHSYSGWLASAIGRGRPRALVMFHGVEPMYHVSFGRRPH